MNIEWIIAAFLVLPAFFFSVTDSPALVDYAIVLYAFNREIRRLVDWYQGHFNPFSPISLTPLIIVALLIGPALGRLNRLHPMPKQAFLLLLMGTAYGTYVGLARTGFAALYGTAEYLSPLALMAYAATSQADDRTADRWMKTAGWAAIAACVYGWYQYLTIPPWDAFWVESVGFVGYLGKLAPTEMSVFSTFAERGTCAAFLALSAIPVMASRRWRLMWGWPEGLLIVSVILLTYCRSGVVLVTLGVVLYPVVNRGKGAGQLVVLLAAFSVAIIIGFDHLPGAERINKRVSTLQHFQEDGSYQGRLGIAQVGAGMVLATPFGYGIGSSGLSGRLNTGTAYNNGAAISDNGYIEVFASLGIPGACCFLIALFLLWRYLALCSRFGLRDDFFALARDLFIVFLIGMTIVNFFNGITVIWIALGRALSPAMLAKVHASPETGEAMPLALREPLSEGKAALQP